MLTPVVTVHTPSKVACGREYQGGIGQTPSSSASLRRCTAAQGDLRIPPRLQCRGDLRTMYNALTAPDIADRSPRSVGV